MSESLVGRIIYVSKLNRDLYNWFYLVAEEGTATVTLVPLRTQRRFDQGAYGWERPETVGDTADALRSCPAPLTVSKGVDAEGRPVLGLPEWNCDLLYFPDLPGEPLLTPGLSYCRFWDGRDVRFWEA
jgi:hypothetical protein